MKRILGYIIVIGCLFPGFVFASTAVYRHIILFQYSGSHFTVTPSVYPDAPSSMEYLWVNVPADQIRFSTDDSIQAYDETTSYFSKGNGGGFWVTYGKYDHSPFFVIGYTYNAGHDTVLEQHYKLYTLFWWFLLIIASGVIFRHYIRTYQAK